MRRPRPPEIIRMSAASPARWSVTSSVLIGASLYSRRDEVMLYGGYLTCVHGPHFPSRVGVPVQSRSRLTALGGLDRTKLVAESLPVSGIRWQWRLWPWVARTGTGLR